MTARNDFNGVLSDWLDDQAGRGAPDYLDEILVRTTRTRQRPRWSSLERWLPVNLTATRISVIRPLHLRTIAIVLVAAALLVAVLALAVGSRRPVPPPFGLAANGVITSWTAGDVFVSNADGSGLHPLIAGATQ